MGGPMKVGEKRSNHGFHYLLNLQENESIDGGCIGSKKKNYVILRECDNHKYVKALFSIDGKVYKG